jgi:uncharacterized phage protein (TIGR02218 family)
MFSGTIADVNCSRYEASLKVNSDSQLLNTMVPKNVYQVGCSNNLYDAACTLLKATYSAAITASTTSDATQTLFYTGTALTVDYFSLGTCVCTSGANAGVSRTIKYNSGNYIWVVRAWPFPVAVGDAFTISWGCDKLQSTCQNKFGNIVNFRGYPFVPAPESVT